MLLFLHFIEIKQDNANMSQINECEADFEELILNDIIFRIGFLIIYNLKSFEDTLSAGDA